jgi:hypothetical protein
MKWDIDKALDALENTGAPGTVIERIQVDPEDEVVLKQIALKVTPGVRRKYESQRYFPVRVVGIGKLQERKLWFHGWTIREAYLRARRAIMKMSASDLAWYGVVPKKKRNSFTTARRKRK